MLKVSYQSLRRSCANIQGVRKSNLINFDSFGPKIKQNKPNNDLWLFAFRVKGLRIFPIPRQTGDIKAGKMPNAILQTDQFQKRNIL